MADLVFPLLNVVILGSALVFAAQQIAEVSSNNTRN